jgi:hypothetical protein
MAWCLVKHRDNFTFTSTGKNCTVRKIRILKELVVGLVNFKDPKDNIFQALMPLIKVKVNVKLSL